MTRRPDAFPADSQADALPVVETTANVPVFIDGLYAVEVDRYGIARLILTAEQREPQSGNVERVVAVRLVLPRAVMAEVGARMLAAAQAPAPNPGVSAPRSTRPLN